jgi:general secretion pathway protein M
MNALAQWWTGLAPRERRMVAMAGTVVVAALLWWLAIAPALATLRAADAQHRALDAQLQSMRAMAAEANALRAQPKISFDESLRSLENGVKQTLGATGQLNVSGERATVVLKGASPEALAQWLAQARANARAVPQEAKLSKSASASAAGAAANTPANAPTWDGTVVLSLPPKN